VCCYPRTCQTRVVARAQSANMTGALAAAMAASKESHRDPSAIGAALPREHVFKMAAQAKLFAQQRAAAAKAAEVQSAQRAQVEDAAATPPGDTLCALSGMRHLLAIDMPFISCVHPLVQYWDMGQVIALATWLCRR